MVILFEKSFDVILTFQVSSLWHLTYDVKLVLEGRRQYDPSPEETMVNRRLGNMGLRRSWITTIFFPMLSLFSRNQYNTQSIENSYFDKSAMRTQLWELNSYGTFNFLQPLTFFNSTNQIHHRVRKTWRQIFPINSMINQT